MTIRSALGRLIRKAKAYVPPSRHRFTGPPAGAGGVPVRNPGVRPWSTVADGNAARWRGEASAMLRSIYVNGAEGLPQTLAREFAGKWADRTGTRHALLVGHGTDALRIGLAAALDHDGLDYGGEIIVPNYSFIASATAALDRRFGVAFVDVDPGTLLVDPQRVEEAVVPGRTRAILPVHLFGQPADMTSLRDIAERHSLKVIEDAAQAHGAIGECGPVGSSGDAGAFSFQSSKNLSCGEGGALVTNDEEIFDRAYSMSNVGRSRTQPDRWGHLSLGWNCRPTEYQAALLLHRLGHFDEQQATRRQNFQRLEAHMESIRCLKPLTVRNGVDAHGMYMYVMRYHPDACGGLDLDEFLEFTRAEGIPIGRSFRSTLSDQPAIRGLIERHPDYFRVLPTPAADQAVLDTVYIPHQVFLGSESDMRDIAGAVGKIERHFSGGSS